MRMQRGIPIGRWLGIPVVVHVSTIGAMALIWLLVADEGPAAAASAVWGAFAATMVLGLVRGLFMRATRLAVLDVTLLPGAVVCRTIDEPGRGAKLVTPTMLSFALCSAATAALDLTPRGGEAAITVLVMNLIPGTPFAAGELMRAARMKALGTVGADRFAAFVGRTASRTAALLAAVAAVAFSSLYAGLVAVVLLACSVVASRAQRAASAADELLHLAPEPQKLTAVDSHASVAELSGPGPWAITVDSEVRYVLTRSMLANARTESEVRAYAVALTQAHIVTLPTRPEVLFAAISRAPGGVAVGVNARGNVQGAWEAATLGLDGGPRSSS